MASLIDNTVSTPRPLVANNQQRPASIASKVFASLINGVHTDFAIIVYRNRVFITVTQCGKIGNLYSIHRDTAQKNGFLGLSALAVYDIKCILGVESEEGNQAVRSLAGKLEVPHPLLLSLTLPVLDFPTISAVGEALLKNKCW